jgi:hypothetical protein
MLGFSTELQNEKSTEDQIALCAANDHEMSYPVILPDRYGILAVPRSNFAIKLASASGCSFVVR